MKLDLDAIEERCKKATPGPWAAQIPAMTGDFPLAKIKPLKITGKLDQHPMVSILDAEFISHARQDIPALLAFAKEAKAALEEYVDRNIPSSTGDYFSADGGEIASKVLEKYF